MPIVEDQNQKVYAIGNGRWAIAMMSGIVQQQERIVMARGVVPRRPARTGRQDRVPKVRVSSASPVKVPSPAKLRPKAAAKPAPPARVNKAKGYNPVAPERVTEILKRLDQLYPEVTCALTHSSAWELLVATIPFPAPID